MKVINKQGNRRLQNTSPSNIGVVQRIAFFLQSIEQSVYKTTKGKEPHIATPSFGASFSLLAFRAQIPIYWWNAS